MSPNTTVTYLVILAIFFLPSSPSFCISSNAGIAIVISCMMMEDVIYGVTLSANTDICKKDPPVKEFRRLNESPNVLFKYAVTWAVSIPGIGSCDPKRTTIRMITVNASFFLSSLFLNAFVNAFAILNHLGFSSKSFDLFFCPCTESICFYCKFLCEFSTA